ncbi:MAG TPA: DinB family protein [Thermoanaerobaculia bacterium]|nr:DinB family protein [Thermoanaerobaculia bacterium]
MSNRTFYEQRWGQDQPAFVRVLRALPADQLDYKPHERSASAGDLAWQLAEEIRVLAEVDASGAINWEARPRPSTLEEIASAYEKNSEKLRSVVSTMDDSRWDGEGRFLFGGQEAWKSTIGDIFWGFFLDSIHHRGQLSAYIRPMGGKVPSIYGPSADDSGGT